MGKVTVGTGPGVFKIEISLDYNGLHQPRGQQDRCLMQILVEDHKVGDDVLQRVNRVRKHHVSVRHSDRGRQKSGRLLCGGLNTGPRGDNRETSVGPGLLKRIPNKRRLGSV